MANPELPLGSAEQFLLTLASISELPARLRLWAFRLDFDNSEVSLNQKKTFNWSPPFHSMPIFAERNC